MELRDYLAVPYKLRAYTARGPDGRWHRYAEYAEIELLSEGDTPMAAMEDLEERRVDFIVERLSRDEEVPVPRLPLVTTADSFSERYLGEIAQRIAEATNASS